MADIFLSYSKSDYALALKLSAFLESEGWSVWWDRSLGAADHYRDEIMKQLVAARAVIAIWSPNSIRSDWVRAEAGRAKADGKLIPVKTPELTYADIPLPFGEMHTENVASTDLIRAAVVAQLAKPSAPLSPFWQVTSTFKYQVLTWVGIVGTSITIFSNLEGILFLSDLAKKVIIHWHEWTQAFWGWVFSLIKVEVEREYVPFISFTVFIVILVVGVNLSVRTGKTPGESQNATPLWGKFRIFVLGVLLYLGGLVLLIFVATAFAPANVYAQWALIFIFTICVPTSYQLYFLKERMWFFIASLLFLVMVGCLLVAPIVAQDTEVGAFLLVDVFFVFVFQIFWMAVMLLSPLQQLTRRLGFAVVGVLTLLLLSEISKLNLHQYVNPPKVSANFGVSPAS